MFTGYCLRFFKFFQKGFGVGVYGFVLELVSVKRAEFGFTVERFCFKVLVSRLTGRDSVYEFTVQGSSFVFEFKVGV